ncbi:drug/metabolite transporter (DMT)-like permease [Sphingomonas naasensis]|uniref:DMT family transporter n=1 Tax=Sphingomonas naasensis TaxID=1344951 RepID=A0A4S1WUV0_9SPHN|nr:DMT family transporter [Sphingomonas naasensis]NIJ18755.1 drug/metabolite transporter (DMT)-like permease [Sphingomonas naasensis]TGX45990.1 DMT family transporter [Sphingomonas naasensis]
MSLAQIHSPGGNALLAGVLCGIGAGALWGLVFLAPELVRSFGPLELAIGRYLAFGLISAGLIAPRWTILRSRLEPRDWRALGWLALAGNTLYYVLLASAVQLGGIAMTSLVIGFLPVAVTIIGSRDQGAVSLARLAPSLLFCVAGAVCVGWQAVTTPVSGGLGAPLIGLLCAIGALVSWTAYAVGNSRCLARLHAISAHDWNLLIGVMTGVQALALIPLAALAGTSRHDVGDWIRFGLVSIGVAVLASIAGNALWNRMTRLLPLTLVGQMILFETLFALLYGFVWEQRLPTLWEVLAFALVVLSVTSCLAAHRKRGVPSPALAA